MFGNLSEARRVFVNSLNNILADTQLESNYKGWKKIGKVSVEHK